MGFRPEHLPAPRGRHRLWQVLGGRRHGALQGGEAKDTEQQARPPGGHPARGRVTILMPVRWGWTQGLASLERQPV